MNLHAGAPYWLLRNGLPAEVASLSANAAADVVVIGGGITGALVADALTKAGRDVLLLDARVPGTGSTAASTALLQYDIDLELGELIERLGETRAVAAYRCAVDAIGRLADITASLDGTAAPDPGFEPRNSLYLASRRRDGARLQREVALRERAGLPAEFWSAERVENRYGFESHGALYSDCAAVVDPMRLAAALLARATARGARVAGRTRIAHIASFPDGVVVETEHGFAVRARHVVIATGYESPLDIVRSFVKLRSTFAVATEPVGALRDWNDGAVVWETRRPYGYMRTTPDQRILAGGGDVPFTAEAARDMLLHRKSAGIAARVARMVPEAHVEIAHSWTGTFGETADGLPYIGEHPSLPNVLFALGYGGNGITFSAIAADLIASLVAGDRPAEADLFGFSR